MVFEVNSYHVPIILFIWFCTFETSQSFNPSCIVLSHKQQNLLLVSSSSSSSNTNTNISYNVRLQRRKQNNRYNNIQQQQQYVVGQQTYKNDRKDSKLMALFFPGLEENDGDDHYTADRRSSVVQSVLDTMNHDESSTTTTPTSITKSKNGSISASTEFVDYINTERAALARLAVAYSPTYRTIPNINQIHQVNVLTIDEDHINIQAIICDEVDCVSLAIPVPFPRSCSNATTCGEFEQCIIENLGELNSYIEEI